MRLIRDCFFSMVAFFAACAPTGQQVLPDRATTETVAAAGRKTDHAQPSAGAEKAANPQEVMDEALAFCQAAQDYWEKGDFDNSFEALDRAYALIVSTDCGDDADLEQQKEDIRLMICNLVLRIHASQHTAVNGASKAIPMDLNPIIQREIETFQGLQRKFFTASYRRSGSFRSLILAALKKAGLPEELSWLPLIESGFKIRALSSARALGLWQFIPTTGYRFGLKRDRWVDERMDVAKATVAAVAYLVDLHGIFGDWTTALAAYNCGENRVLRVIRSQNIDYLDNFWDLYEKLPGETRRYVPRFLAALHILRDPKKYGFDLGDPDKPPDTVEVNVARQLDLKQVSKLIHVPADVLASLNPDLRIGITPPREYALTVLRDKEKMLVSSLEKIPVYTPPKKRFTIHHIQSGETLSHLARRYHLSIDAIARVNKIKKTAVLHIDQCIKIPVSTKTHGRVSRVERPGKTPVTKPIHYRVSRGDTLWKVASRYDTDVASIKRLNKLDGEQLHAGQDLVIRPNARTREIPANASGYEVKPGDSPYSIAKQNNMKLEDFLRLNRLKPTSRIFPGQKLLVEDR
ncbi:MAG TPA: LysM peptidoglycan-binding domain-containing protein [Myxococcota bacterium]|nr:LysM peptidoglycan-binding domain-containing protein [Myxococcota bacterium]